jgi:5-methylcytosine-specific restriction endonuclease McrA
MNKELRLSVYEKYSGNCAYCGCEIVWSAFQVDHIIPKQSGGSDDLENLNPACRQCNNFKNVFSLEEFRREVSMQVERARKYSVNFRTAERFGMIEVKPKPIVFYFEQALT